MFKLYPTCRNGPLFEGQMDTVAQGYIWKNGNALLPASMAGVTARDNTGSSSDRLTRDEVEVLEPSDGASSDGRLHRHKVQSVVDSTTDGSIRTVD